MTVTQLPLPPDLYDPHPYVDDEFGRCLGCTQDALAPCHVEEQGAVTSTA